VVKSILSPEGQIIYNYLPQEGVRVVSEKVARQVRRMMAKVVQYGTGQSANISGYGSGGKTGTSQKIDPVTGSYSYEKFTSYFIGFTPLNSPRVSILIIVDEPEGVSYGGVVAAPVFKKIGERILPLLGVESEMVSRTNGVLNVSDSIPDNQDTGVVNNTVTLDGQLKRMPDLKGLSYREVLNILSRNGISATLSGNGFVEEQTPPPGTIINTGTRCSVKLKPLI
jgi:cell division protein FtsI (penicillin-binding protein 3)